MRTARTTRLATAALAPVLLVLVCAAGPALADEPEPPADVPPVTVPADEVPAEDVPVLDPPGEAVGVVEGVPVGLAEAVVPPAAPVAEVAVPAERVATAIVDGVEVGLVEAPVPQPVTEPTPIEAPAVRLPVVAATPPAPVQVPGPPVAAVPTVALVLAAWG
jgi:hypothetical protein